MGDSYVINSSVDQVLENLPIGSISRAIGNNLFGINATQTGNPVPRSKDSVGFVFFTRPQLNMTLFNLSNYRGFYSLLSGTPTSYQRYVRLMLDPRLQYTGELTCPFVDPLNAFIPMLTNNVVSVGGFPDLTAPTYTSAAGLYGQETGFVDGVTNHLESMDLDVTFRNMRGNPLIYLIYIWVKYQTLVFEGIFNPYFDFITENELDYNTRIYRIVLDQTKRYVSYIACTGASYPVSVPSGSLLDFNIDKPLNDSNGDINVRFKSYGVTLFDDIVKKEFNEAQAIFNPGIRKLLQYDLNNDSIEGTKREDPYAVYSSPGGAYSKVPHNLLSQTEGSFVSNPFYKLNHRVYPYINLHTNELEWWARADELKAAIKEFTGEK